MKNELHESNERKDPDQPKDNTQAGENKRIGSFFDDYPDGASRIAAVHARLAPYVPYEKELGFSASELTESIDALKDVDTREEFVSDLYQVLLPLKEKLDQKPELLERIKRRQNVEEKGFTSLDSEDFISYERGGDDWMRIHISPGKTIELNKQMGLLLEGIKKLAEAASQDESIKGIAATSWLVAKFPKIMTGLGFTLDGSIPAEERAAHFSTTATDIPISAAHIDREALIKKYGKK